MIYLFTGAIGTGKTLYVVTELKKIHEQNEKYQKDGQLDKVRPIFSNIDGLKVPHQDIPDDWRDCGPSSIIVYDECHKIPLFQPGRGALIKDERAIALNESRHDGVDIYFITQHPKYIHNHIKGLVNKHYHFHRAMGLGAATVFMWSHGNTSNPDSQAAKNLAENEFIFNYPAKNYDSYNSAVEHTVKRKIPKKLLAWVLAPFALLAIIAYLLMKPSTTGNLTGKTFQDTANDLDQAQKNLSQSENQQQPTGFKGIDERTQEQREKDYKAELDRINEQRIKYDPNHPYNVKIENPNYVVTVLPQFAGCVKYNGKYQAYTQQGTRLDVSQDDCKKLMNGDRPFNYFQQQQPMQTLQQTNQSTTEQQPMSLEMQAKMQQAKEQGLI